ncbi:MAG: hypothetical protein U0790_25090, partial [Isosphaeraceae bacterium]
AELSRLSDLRNASAGVRTLNDRCDCLAAIAEEATSIEEVKTRAESMFTDLAEHNCVSLSSIHRAKGLERDRVVILRPELIPGPWATTKRTSSRSGTSGTSPSPRPSSDLRSRGISSLFRSTNQQTQGIDRRSDGQAVGQRNA